MAFTPNPELLISGSVTRVSDRTDFNTKAPKGRVVQVLTRTGFQDVRVPQSQDLEILEGSHVLWAVDVNHWSMPDEQTGLTKTGLSVTFNSAVSAADLSGFEAVILAGVSA